MAESKPIPAEGIAKIGELNDNLRESIKLIEEFKEQVKETYNISAKLISTNVGKSDTKSVDATTKAIKESNEARRTQLELETLQLKLQEQLNLSNKAEQQALQEQLKLKVAENREAEKATKQAQKEEKARQELLSEYAKAQKQLTELSKRQRELAIRQELGNKLTRDEAKELKALTIQIQRLDIALKNVDESQGKFQRSVGNYKKAVEGLKKAGGSGGAFLGGFLGGAVGAQISKGIDDIFAGTAEKAENFQLIIERTFNLISNVGVAVKNFIVGYAIPQFEQLGLKIERAFTFDSDRLEAIDVQLKETNKTLDAFKNPFEGIIDRIKETDELTKRQVKLRYEYIRQEALLATAIQRRAGKEQVLAQIAEDDTLGFKTRRDASKDLLKTQEERLNLERNLASKQLELQKNLVKISLEKEGLAGKFTDEQIKSLSFLKDEEAFRKVNLEALEGLKTAQANYNQLQIESEIFKAERAEKDRKANQDALENELDYLKDRFDAQKAYNESIIGNDRILFKSRVELLEQTKKASDKSFIDQKDALNEFLKTQKGYAGQVIDLTELMSIEDAKALEEKVRGYNLSEKVEQLILQSIREKQTANKDFYESDKALAQEKRDRDQRIAQSVQAQQQENYDFAIDRLERQYNKEETLQEQRFVFASKKLNELANLEETQKQQQILDQFDFEKEQIKATIVEEDEKRQRILELETKLQHDLQKLSDDTNNLVIANNRKQFISRLDYAQKYADNFVGLLNEELQKENDERQKYLDRQITQRQNNISAQQALFEQGRENQLAFEQAQLAKLELQRKDAEERSAKQAEVLQLIQATYQSYIARLKANEKPSQALLGASADTLLLKAIAKGVSGAFWEGSERIEDDLKGNKVHNGRDGYIVAVDGGERVLNTAQNKLIGDMSNDDLASLAYQYNKGSLSTATNIYNSIDLQPTLSKLSDIHEELASRPTQVFRVNEFGQIMEVLITKKYVKKTVISPWRKK